MTTAKPLPQPSEALTIPRLLRRNAQEFAQRPALSTGFDHIRGP